MIESIGLDKSFCKAVDLIEVPNRLTKYDANELVPNSSSWSSIGNEINSLILVFCSLVR